MNIDEIQTQLGLYGQVLSGSETDEERAKLLRNHYLKTKVRRLMDQENLGDIHDIAADVNKSLLLAVGILSGAVTDQGVIDRYRAYVAAQIQGYGGPKSIMDKLEKNAMVLGKWLGLLTDAKAAIVAAKDAEAVSGVDVE